MGCGTQLEVGLCKKCQFFYKNVIHKKFVKPCYQSKLSQEFAIPVNDSNLWKNIYTRKVKDINDNKIAEFNYKMLHNILCNNAYGKWLRDNGG